MSERSGQKIALIQMSVGHDSSTNVDRALTKISEAANNGASLIVLPESFNSPYGPGYFDRYAECIPGPTTNRLCEEAKKLNVHLIGGTIPEKCPDTGKIYNTCPIVNNLGRLIGKYRKIHMFDLDMPGETTFKESDFIEPGTNPVILKLGACKIGLGICHDLRFGEMARLYTLNGCQLLVFPGAFNMGTGSAHWSLLVRGLALDAQCYVAACSTARDLKANHVAWGHSLISDPWGRIVGSTEENEDIIYAEIDSERVDEVRKMIPLYKQRRTDLYDTYYRTKTMIFE